MTGLMQHIGEVKMVITQVKLKSISENTYKPVYEMEARR